MQSAVKSFNAHNSGSENKQLAQQKKAIDKFTSVVKRFSAGSAIKYYMWGSENNDVNITAVYKE